MVDDLLEPLKIYNGQLKEEHKNNTIKYFDELTEKSGVDVEANRKTIKKYKETEAEEDRISSYLSKKKVLRTCLIILFVLLGFVAIFIFGFNLPTWAKIVICLLCVASNIGIIVSIIKVINPKLKELKNAHDLILEALAKLKNEAYMQMQPLNILYDWNIPATIINMSNSLIHMDKFFDAKKYQYLYEKFGLDENTVENVSSYYVQSGSILGNPFLICNDYRQDWVNHTYTGSITIHWTERVKTQNGWTTESRSQVLTASVVKPAPLYRHVTYLIYGNDAAPNLTFSREPSKLSGEDDSLQYRKVLKEAKKLDKKAEKELMDDDPTTNYTRFGNDEFEVIFGGTDRDNEMEYRLLFTPLAQRNLLDLLNNAKPYGDDFYMDKIKKLNYIQSRHSQNFDYNCNPEQFVDFDYDRAREKFINYNCLYFQNFFFDMAPLISIPLYQQTKTIDYIYKDEYRGNIPTYEHEAMANSFGSSVFNNPMADTDAILKCSIDRKVGKADQVKVTAHSFQKVLHVDYVPTFGGDGKTHNVPVEWYEYAPLIQESYMAVEEKDSSRLEYINMNNNESFNNLLSGIGGLHHYQRGLFATILNKALEQSDLDAFNKFYQGNSNINNNNDLREYIMKTVRDLESKAANLNNGNSSNVGNSTNIQGSNSEE